MKKWLTGILIIVIVFLIGCQVFIPQNITLARTISAKANLNGVYRFLTIDSSWLKWWPEQSTSQGSRAHLPEISGFRFEKTKLSYNSFEVTIENNKIITPSQLYLVAQGKDSLKIEWAVIRQAKRNNPFSKIKNYLQVRNLDGTMGSVLAALQKHISQVRNIYGLDIRKEKIAIEFLVSKRIKISHYPANKDIYGLMNEIREHLRKKEIKEEALPIFNIEPMGNEGFELLVAVPVARQLADEGSFTTLKLLKKGDILVAETYGDLAAVDSALQQLKIYAKDHHHLNVARPYRIFLNDHLDGTDSSKWLTRISYPYL